jgi:hypothetical protein
MTPRVRGNWLQADGAGLQFARAVSGFYCDLAEEVHPGAIATDGVIRP